MKMVTIKSSGSTKKMQNFFKSMKKRDALAKAKEIGSLGVQMLADATPVKTGLAASSWSYEIEKVDGGLNIYWNNSDVEGGLPVVLLIQYGHGTGAGAYIAPNDFINPVTKELMTQMAEETWKEVEQS